MDVVLPTYELLSPPASPAQSRHVGWLAVARGTTSATAFLELLATATRAGLVPSDLGRFPPVGIRAGEAQRLGPLPLQPPAEGLLLTQQRVDRFGPCLGLENLGENRQGGVSLLESGAGPNQGVPAARLGALEVAQREQRFSRGPEHVRVVGVLRQVLVELLQRVVSSPRAGKDSRQVVAEMGAHDDIAHPQAQAHGVVPKPGIRQVAREVAKPRVHAPLEGVLDPVVDRAHVLVTGLEKCEREVALQCCLRWLWPSPRRLIALHDIDGRAAPVVVRPERIPQGRHEHAGPFFSSPRRLR